VSRRYGKRTAHMMPKRNSHQIKVLRELLCQMYGEECTYCGRADRKLTLDHIWPRGEGGTWYLRNLQLLCWPCHSKKDSDPGKRRGWKRSLKIVEKWGAARGEINGHTGLHSCTIWPVCSHASCHGSDYR